MHQNCLITTHHISNTELRKRTPAVGNTCELLSEVEINSSLVCVNYAILNLFLYSSISMSTTLFKIIFIRKHLSQL